MGETATKGYGNGKKNFSASGPPLGNVEGFRLSRLLRDREREMEGCGNGAFLMKLTWG